MVNMDKDTATNITGTSVEFTTDEEVLVLGKMIIEENREAFEVLAQ